MTGPKQPDTCQTCMGTRWTWKKLDDGQDKIDCPACQTDTPAENTSPEPTPENMRREVEDIVFGLNKKGWVEKKEHFRASFRVQEEQADEREVVKGVLALLARREAQAEKRGSERMARTCCPHRAACPNRE